VGGHSVIPIIKLETWKKDPDHPGAVIFDQQRVAQDIFNELETHLKTDGRLPDEYFLFDTRTWKDGALFPRDGEILCITNYGGSEGIYLDISVRHEKDVYEFNQATHSGEWKKRMVIEHFATGKTLGDSVDDLDRMHLVASSVTAAFYGSRAEVQERYAKIKRGDIEPQYPHPSHNEKQMVPKQKQSLADKLQAASEKTKAQDAQNIETPATGKKGKKYAR